MTEKSPTRKTKRDSEGAPKLETPEEPKAIPVEVPRDEASPLETPEDPTPLVRDETTVIRFATFMEDDSPVITEVAEEEATQSDIADLFQHVAQSPVDAHAPIWAARSPNTTGGYS